MNIKNIFITILLSIVFLGCQKDNKDHYYSCNEEINDWVVANKSEIQKMNRNDLLQYNEDYQRSIFRAFTSKQRIACWKEKFDEVLVLNWNENEKNHIQLLLQSLDENWFIENELEETSYQCRIRDVFLKEWIEKGINELNWTSALIYSMVACMETITCSNGFLVEYYSAADTSKGSGQGTCLCSTESDWCNLGMNELGTCLQGLDNCIPSSIGCGTLWTYRCNGKCQLGIIEDKI